ncbi:unnamed protein product, partial [Allacma fusca]
KRFTQQL